MSTKRRQGARRIKNEDGTGYLCSCGCGRVPTPPRLTWFSKECVHEWKIRNQPAYVRQQMLKRDKGICAGCGRNAEKLRTRFYTLRRASDVPARHLPRAKNESIFSCRKIRHLSRWHERSGFPSGNRSWWDADHIVEVVRGGGQCGLDNYQTLCVPCHKRKTARLARELAEQRRRELNPNLELDLV